MTDIETDEAKRGPGRPPKPKLLPVRLLRGYVPMMGGEKLKAGSVVEIPADEARRAVDLGIAVRADAF